MQICYKRQQLSRENLTLPAEIGVEQAQNAKLSKLNLFIESVYASLSFTRPIKDEYLVFPVHQSKGESAKCNTQFVCKLLLGICRKRFVQA